MFSIPINQPVRCGLMGMGNMSLGEREPENETDNFGRSSLEGVAANWMMKCDGRWEVNHRCI